MVERRYLHSMAGDGYEKCPENYRNRHREECLKKVTEKIRSEERIAKFKPKRSGKRRPEDEKSITMTMEYPPGSLVYYKTRTGTECVRRIVSDFRITNKGYLATATHDKCERSFVLYNRIIRLKRTGE